MSWWFKFSDLNNSTVEYILKHGLIEDIVSKERINKKFQNGVLSVLSKTKTIRTETKFFDLLTYCGDDLKHEYHPKQLLNLLKRIPNLSDGQVLKNWDQKMIKKLAETNQSIIKWNHSDDKMVLNYIEAVKEINKLVNFNDIDYIFRPYEQVRQLWTKYPEMHFKLQLMNLEISSELSAYERNHCHYLLIVNKLNEDEAIFNIIDCSNVKVVRNYSTDVYDFAMFPSMTKLHIDCTSDVENKFSLNNLNISSKLTQLTIKTNSWDPQDDEAIKHIIDHHPLIKLKIHCKRYFNEFYENSILKMILNSPNKTIKTVKLNRLVIKKKVMTINNLNETDLNQLQDNWHEQVSQLLQRFRSIRVINLPIEAGAEYVKVIHIICQSVEQSDHRRCIYVELN